jgi:hypothetical protein
MDDARTIAEEQGWNDDTLGNLAWEFIDNLGLADSFTDYLRAVAAQENEGSEYTSADMYGHSPYFDDSVTAEALGRDPYRWEL